jgi:hypothetical protein
VIAAIPSSRSPQEAFVPVKYVKLITREMVQAEPDARFVFGDNLQRFGLGGQAGAMRGEPNAIGVATKRAPGRDDEDFFADTDECRSTILDECRQVRAALDEGRTVYVPADGLGTGLSELPTRAPGLAQLLVDTFRGFDGEPCPWADVQTNKADVLIAYKGFNRDLTCRDFQYEIGGTYRIDGEPKACERGFHACEHPLNVFDYYAPAGSRFCEVEMHGPFSRDGSDTKVASASITIRAEVQLGELIQRAVKWVFDRAKPEGPGSSATGDGGAASATGYRGAASATGYRGAASATGDGGAASATGYRGAASATGYRGAASATGYQGAASATGYQGAASATGNRGAASATGDGGAASATGYQGAASATGYRGAASATGDGGAASATGDGGAASATGDGGAASATGYRGAASATGYRGAASATGDGGVALAAGYDGQAMAGPTGAIFLVNRADDGSIRHVFASKVGENGLQAGVFYRLDDNGKPAEVA